MGPSVGGRIDSGDTARHGPAYNRVSLLGVGVHAIDMAMALQTIDGWIARREPHYVTVTPAHAVMDAYRDPGLRKIFNASGLTTPDGMAIVWLLRLYGHRNVARVYGPDLMIELCAHGLERGYRHFLFGGGPGTALNLSQRLRAQIPGLEVVGTFSPPFTEPTPKEDELAIQEIASRSPDIVWVGLSTPKQERWMAAHIGRVAAPVLIGVGAAFDFLSGGKPQAPRWMQRSGLEWLFRLATEPRRLWPRYRQYPKFVLLAAAQWLKLKDYPLES